MCYHKSLNATAPELEARYEAQLPPGANFQPVYHANAYNVPAWPIATRQEPGKLQLIHWGLIPRWAKTHQDAADIRLKTINARSETIYEKPSYRTAAQKGQRCLIPVTVFMNGTRLALRNTRSTSAPPIRKSRRSPGCGRSGPTRRPANSSRPIRS
jgi:putative SOS response-associated peptidase YedK